MAQREISTSKINIPYYKSYATDIVTYRLRLSPEQIVNAQMAIAEICLYGETEYKPIGIEKMYFDKLHKDLKDSIPTYKASVINGSLGGRPKTQKEPTGYLQDNPEDNPQANQSRTINRTIPIAKNKTNLEITIDDFKKHRKQLRKPMTEKAITLLKKTLNNLASTEEEQIEILNQSIENGWVGIFELKKENKKNETFDLFKNYKDKEMIIDVEASN